MNQIAPDFTLDAIEGIADGQAVEPLTHKQLELVAGGECVVNSI